MKMLKSEGEKGVFTLSIDLECAWGSGKKSLIPAHLQERATIDKFLLLCEKYRISCTWAVVGNLFLKDKKEAADRSIKVLGRGKYVYAHMSGHDETLNNNLWFGEDIIQKILGCKVAQEIGCHTFFHSLDSETNPVDFAEELRQSSRIAKEKFGVELKSFVYPKNKIWGGSECLKRSGRVIYRGSDKKRNIPIPGMGQLFKIVDEYFGLPALEVYPYKDEHGLMVVSGSYFYPTILKGRFCPPMKSRVRKCLGGINNAIRHGGIFHLWFHFHNISLNPEYWLDGLEKIFIDVRGRVRLGNLEVKTMGELVHW